MRTTLLIVAFVMSSGCATPPKTQTPARKPPVTLKPPKTAGRVQVGHRADALSFEGPAEEAENVAVLPWDGDANR